MKKKAVTGIFFILSCFAAMFVLLEFHDNYLFVGIAAMLLLVSSFCFLNALFAEKSKEWGALEEEDAKESSGRTEGDFKKNIINYMEAMNQNQTQMLQELKSQKQAMTAQMKSLEKEIVSLSEKQMFQTKTVVKYNKENARQLALNEKKVVEQAVKELKEIMVENASRMVATPFVAVAQETEIPVPEEVVIPGIVPEVPMLEEVVVPEIQPEMPMPEEVVVPEIQPEMPMPEEIVVPEVQPEMPIPEEVVVPEVQPEMPILEEVVIPEIVPEVPMSEEVVIPVAQEAMTELSSIEDMEIPELPSMEELDLPVLDDIVVEEEPAAPPVMDSDPNKMMTPDDIAKLLASMGM